MISVAKSRLAGGVHIMSVATLFCMSFVSNVFYASFSPAALSGII